jgi:hypothetical protein
MRFSPVRRRLSAAVLAAAAVTTAGAGLGGCSSSSTDSNAASAVPSTSPTTAATAMDAMGMSASDPMYTGTGLSASDGGFTFVPAQSSLAAGGSAAFHYKVVDAQGATVTSFVPDQTKLMHFYLVRTDLAGFQHVHPTMAADGTWTAGLAALAPGSYRAYVAFNAKDASGKTVAEVLSTALTVPGQASMIALPAVATTTTADGYTLTVSGDMMAAMSHELTITVSKGGAPVTDLQPYLETYAHLTAIHSGDLAFAHLHPQGAAATTDNGGPTLTFHTMMPESGSWRFFIQFQTGGVLHTAAITLHVA